MTDDPQERSDLAAELALGLLEGAERAEALRLCLADSAFAAEVEGWSHRLSPLLDTHAAETPSPAIWRAIAARIGHGDTGRVQRRLRWWQGGALAASAVAACLAVLLVTRPVPIPAPKPPADPASAPAVAISQLAGAGNATTVAISYDPARGLLRLGSARLGSDTKSPELWVIPEDGVPRSLGMIRPDGGSLAVNAALRRFLRDGVTLAITLEDPATAPHKAPSAAPILTGKISII